MTTENLSGRALDRAVAEAMGWRSVVTGPCAVRDCRTQLVALVTPSGEHAAAEHESDAEAVWELCPAFSTDGNAMLEVIAWLAGQGWWVQLSIPRDNLPNLCLCTLKRYGREGSKPIIIQEETNNIAQAVARAVLAVAGREDA